MTTSVLHIPVVLPRNNFLVHEESWHRYKFHQHEFSPLLAILNYIIEEKKLRMMWSLHCFFKAVFRLCVDIDTVHFDLFSCFSGNVYSNSCVLISAEKGFLQKFLWKYNMAPMKLTEKRYTYGTLIWQSSRISVTLHDETR